MAHQPKTEYEKRQEEEARAVRDRRETAAGIEKGRQDAQAALRNQQDIDRAKAAGDKAYKEWGDHQSALADEREANRRAATQAAAEQAVIVERRRVAATAELAASSTSGLITECDRLAAAPADDTRPLGLEGIATKAINFALAVPACRAEVTRRPNSARTTYQYGRSLIAAGRCAEGYQLLYDARKMGNSAAHFAMGYGASDTCFVSPPYRQELEEAFAEGNGTAGVALILDDLGPNKIVGYHVDKSPIAARAAKAIAMLRPRAEAGDSYAIQMMATLSATRFVEHPLSADEQKSWVSLCKARGITACASFAR